MMKMKRKYISILICALCSLLSASAQNTLSSSAGSSASGRSLGTHDNNGNPIDTTAVTDAKTIPIGLYQWKVTRRLGNVVPVAVDTLHAGFQNSNDPAGPTGQYNYLGNLGAPRMSRIFFDRFVCTDSCGRYIIEYYANKGEARLFHHEMKEKYPLIMEKGRIRSGYLSLTPVFEDTNYQIYVHL